MTTTIDLDKNNDQDETLSETDNDRSFSSSADSESSNSCPFNPEISSKLTSAFAKATGIDQRLANRLLNQYEWNIDLALKATYEVKERSKTITDKKQISNVEQEIREKTKLDTISLNVNLPDSDDEEINEQTQEYAEKLVEFLLEEKPLVIFLRNIGTFALTLLITCLSSSYDDESIQIDPPKNSNYLSILTKKSELKKSKVSVFENENHWRMLQIEVSHKDSIRLDLFNTFIDENSSFDFQQIDQHPANNLLICSMTIEKSKKTEEIFSKTLTEFCDSTNDGKCHDRLFYRPSASDENSIKPILLEQNDHFLFNRSIVRGTFVI